jgi:hypothetical protein
MVGELALVQHPDADVVVHMGQDEIERYTRRRPIPENRGVNSDGTAFEVDGGEADDLPLPGDGERAGEQQRMKVKS